MRKISNSFCASAVFVFVLITASCGTTNSKESADNLKECAERYETIVTPSNEAIVVVNQTVFGTPGYQVALEKLTSTIEDLVNELARMDCFPEDIKPQVQVLIETTSTYVAIYDTLARGGIPTADIQSVQSKQRAAVAIIRARLGLPAANP